MADFNKILNWKLLSGSHDFPGPEGGTCINEAAIVAAGFKYKSVRSAEDCPPCFSRPISMYAIYLNDRMPDSIRNELLMPFVTRLSGTADTPAVETKRAEFMIVQISRRMIAKYLSKRSLPSELFARAKTLTDVRAAAIDLDIALARDFDRALARALAIDLDIARALDFDRALARALALARDIDFDLWRDATAILDEAIMLGNHGDAIDQGLVIERMAKIRELA